MQIKTVIFDWDGTLIDSWPIAYEVLKKLFHELRNEKVEENSSSDIKIRKNWGYPGPILFPKYFPDHDSVKIRQTWLKIQNDLLWEKLCLFPGTMDTLKFLKEKEMILGLLTSRTGESLINLLRSNELDNKLDVKYYFDFIQTYKMPSPDKSVIKPKRAHHNHFESSFHKPRSRVFDKIVNWLREKGITIKEIVYVGDSLADLAPARKRGIKFVGVLTGPINTRQRWLEWGGLDPQDVIDSITDFPEWLQKYQNKPR